MAGLSKVSLPIGTTASGTIPAELYQPINDLYIALTNLVTQLNATFPVMMSPNKHYWVATISNTGAITWTDVGTIRP